MTTHVESLRASNFSATAGFEFLSRYLFVEDHLRGRRVLEKGTLDARSLLRLQAAGAQRVVGTAHEIDSLAERQAVRSRLIEIVAMPSGRVDFADGSFDTVLVPDLAVEIASNAAFLREVRRVLSSRGFCLLCFESSGRSLSTLVQDAPRWARRDATRLHSMVSDVFPDVRFYHQYPFVGVSIQPESASVATDLSFDPALSSGSARPSHVIAVCGPGSPTIEERMLVELPFEELERLSAAQRATTARDLDRLLSAVRTLRTEVSKKDAALKELGARLPALRKNLQAKISRLGFSVPGDSGLPAQTTSIDSESARDHGDERHSSGPMADDLLGEDRAPRDTIWQVESSAVDEREPEREPDRNRDRDRDEQLDGLEQECETLRLRAEVLQAELRHRARAAEDEREQLLKALSDSSATVQELQTRLESVLFKASNFEREVLELRDELTELRAKNERFEDTSITDSSQRIAGLQKIVQSQATEIEELRMELERQRTSRGLLGSDYRGSEARAADLEGQLRALTFEKKALEKQLLGKVEALNLALSESAMNAEGLSQALVHLEAERREFIERVERAESAERSVRASFEREHQIALELRRDLDRARHQAHDNAGDVERSTYALMEKDSIIAQLRQNLSSAETQKQAVELVAGHLSREADGLRSRVRELRQERDALAATSALLVDERDAARDLVEQARGRVSEAIDAARAEEREHARRAAEEVVSTLERSREELARRLSELSEENHKLRTDTSVLEARSQKAEEALMLARERIGGLDREMATLQRRLEVAERAEENGRFSRTQFEMALRDAASEARANLNEVEAWRARAHQLESKVGKLEAEVLDARAGQHRAEGQVATAVIAQREAESGRAISKAALAQSWFENLKIKNRFESAERKLASFEAQNHPASWEEQLRALTTELERERAAHVETKTALDKTLEEAAKLDAQLRSAASTSRDAERERLLRTELRQQVLDLEDELSFERVERALALEALRLLRLEQGLEQGLEEGRGVQVSLTKLASEPSAERAVSEMQYEGPESSRVEALERELSELRLHVQQLVSERDDAQTRFEAAGARHAAEVDEVRAMLGRTMAELRTARGERGETEQRLAQERSNSDILRARLEQQGEVEALRREIEVRDEQIARLVSDAESSLLESNRLRSLLQASEQHQVMLERRIAALEVAAQEASRSIEMLRRELVDKNERLRRLSDLKE